MLTDHTAEVSSIPLDESGYLWEAHNVFFRDPDENLRSGYYQLVSENIASRLAGLPTPSHPIQRIEARIQYQDPPSDLTTNTPFFWSLLLARRSQTDPDLCLISQFTSTFLTAPPNGTHADASEPASLTQTLWPRPTIDLLSPA